MGRREKGEGGEWWKRCWRNLACVKRCGLCVLLFACRNGGGIGSEGVRKTAYFDNSMDLAFQKVSHTFTYHFLTLPSPPLPNISLQP